MIDFFKSEKKTELSKIADSLSSKFVLVDGVSFPAGVSNYRNYKDMYDLALLLGLDKGLVPSTNGFVELTAEQMKKLLIKVGKQNYITFVHLRKLYSYVDSLKDGELIKAVKWGSINGVS